MLNNRCYYSEGMKSVRSQWPYQYEYDTPNCVEQAMSKTDYRKADCSNNTITNYDDATTSSYRSYSHISNVMERMIQNHLSFPPK
jgi:hypothetical protein